MAKELTIEEFAKATKNGSYNVEHEDTWNIRIEMVKASITYDEEYNEIVFNSIDGGASFYIDAELIEEITEENGSFNIKFDGIMSDLSITRSNN